jgi:hypothetical protein
LAESIALNVPAVYDVFAVAIKETVGFQQPQKCGGEKPHKGRKTDCGFSEPEGATAPEAYTDLLCAVCFALYFFT